MINNVIKKGNEDVNQDVPDNICDMLMIEFQTHRKDEQVALVNSEVDRKLVQTRDFGTNAKATIQNNVSTLRRKVRKRLHMDVSFTHMDNLSFHYKTNVQKWKYVLQIWTTTGRELGEKALDCKGVMKADELMKTITNDGPRYDKLVK